MKKRRVISFDPGPFTCNTKSNFPSGYRDPEQSPRPPYETCEKNVISRCSSKLIRQPQERTARVRKDLSETLLKLFQSALYLPFFYPRFAVDRKVSASDSHGLAGKGHTDAIVHMKASFFAQRNNVKMETI